MKKMRKVLHKILENELTPGEVIRGARVEAKISQEDMEKISGIKRSNISALENDRIAMTSHYAEIFGTILKLHPADILYPNRVVKKTDIITKIEKRVARFLRTRTAS